MLDTPLGLLPIPPGFKLSYRPDFLFVAKSPDGLKAPYDILPLPPVSATDAPLEERDEMAEGSGSRLLWRGECLISLG